MKKAFTLAEVIMAAIVLTLLAVVMVSTLKSNLPNTDLVKFRYAYGTILEIIAKMANNQDCYPTENLFARKPRTGCEFHNTFKSYLNVYKTNNVNVSLSQINYIPDSQGRRNETSISLRSGNNSKGNNSICFIDNKGILYCVPELCTNENTVECFRNIKDFEIRLYLDKKLGKNGETVNIGLDRTLFINVSRTGKVTVPGITMGKEVDCGLAAHQKGYYQCSLSTMIESM